MRFKASVASAPITANITKVVFGLNKDHADITSSYTGTLVDVEQDVPVYAYYVKDGGNYQVYFLANDDIYLPKSCYNFFYHAETSTGMSALKSLDLSNTNTSRVEIMSRMFRNCSALTDLDIKHWDVSNVNLPFYDLGLIGILCLHNLHILNQKLKYS